MLCLRLPTMEEESEIHIWKVQNKSSGLKKIRTSLENITLIFVEVSKF